MVLQKKYESIREKQACSLELAPWRWEGDRLIEVLSCIPQLPWCAHTRACGFLGRHSSQQGGDSSGADMLT